VTIYFRIGGTGRVVCGPRDVWIRQQSCWLSVVRSIRKQQPSAKMFRMKLRKILPYISKKVFLRDKPGA
jgi:hypothetical protein